MIHIIQKPTDTPDDNSTAMVAAELTRMGAAWRYLDLACLDPYSGPIRDDLIWVCGMRQDQASFELLNILAIENRVVNAPDAIATCASKARTTGLLLKSGVPTPDTLFTSSRAAADSFIERHGRVVYKPLYGYDGNGIFPLTSTEELPAPPYYLQEYIENDRDFRIFVLDGEAIGAIERRSDGFAHNIHQGGSGRAVAISPEMAEIAGAAACAIGIDYCGVDLLIHEGNYTVLEVNGTPNWHCMGVPIPRFIARYLIEQEKASCRR
jgi:tetrahydromethanopterin:alpha-L-glutamate ligase